MQITVGSTLGRAWDQDQEVDIMVEGLWVSGRIAALDGTGVAIDSDNFERYVIRLEMISVVRIRSFGSEPALPVRHPNPRGIEDVA